LELLRALAAQASVSIANARMYEQIRAFSQGLEEKVVERTEELRDFVSAVYHELSTPITSMKGYSALLLSGTPGPLTERQERYLVSIRSSVDRLSRLLSDLSDVSRMERGQLQIDAGPVDLDEASPRQSALWHERLKKKGFRSGMWWSRAAKRCLAICIVSYRF
jgi:signal transduction histidine kinase